jgi:hypothetical protein
MLVLNFCNFAVESAISNDDFGSNYYSLGQALVRTGNLVIVTLDGIVCYDLEGLSCY